MKQILVRKKIEKKRKEYKHVEEKREKEEEQEERFCSPGTTKKGQKQEKLLLPIRTGNSTVRVCISSMYFYLQVFLQCVSYLEHISRLHLFPELAANS